jgi:hypothetical protein
MRDAAAPASRGRPRAAPACCDAAARPAARDERRRISNRRAQAKYQQRQRDEVSGWRGEGSR